MTSELGEVTPQVPLAGGDPGQMGSETKRINVSTLIETKWMRVLAALYARRRIHRFMAERTLHDHALPSTISYLQSRGLQIEREEITVPGFRGTPTRCKEYWLFESIPNRDRAAELLGLGTVTNTDSGRG